MSGRGWIGVDLDGTLAHYDGWIGSKHIGMPIIPMVERVLDWLERGVDVRIFTARAADPDPEVLKAITRWCEIHLGRALPVTNVKDFGMVRLYDDRAIQVRENTGELVL